MIGDIILDGVDVKIFKRDKIDSFQTDIKMNGAEFLQNSVALRFSWSVIYASDIGYITLEGRIHYIDTPATISKLKASWSDGKKIPPEFVQEIFNAINYYCTVNSALIMKTLDVVPPIKIPQIVASQAKE